MSSNYAADIPVSYTDVDTSEVIVRSDISGYKQRRKSKRASKRANIDQTQSEPTNILSPPKDSTSTPDDLNANTTAASTQPRKKNRKHRSTLTEVSPRTFTNKTPKTKRFDKKETTRNSLPRSWGPSSSPPSSSPPVSPHGSPVPQLKKKIGSGFMQRVRRLTDVNESDRKSFTLTRDDFPRKPDDINELSTYLSSKSEEDSKITQREMVVNEIISTERQYLDDLALLINDFLEPMRNMNIPKESLQKLFGNIEVIHNINSDVLSDLLARQQSKGDYDILVGDVFLNLYNYFRLYTMYCIEQQNAIAVHKTLLQNQEYANHLTLQKQNPKCRQLELPDLLIKPMQRLCKYPLLLRELMKATEEDHEDYENLNTALKQVSKVVQYINERKRLGENQQKIVDIQQSLEDCPSLLLNPSRKFIRDGEITLILGKNRTYKANLFLFNDSLLVAKNKKQKLLEINQYKGFVFCSIYLLKETRVVDIGDTPDMSHVFEVSAKSDPNIKSIFCARNFDEKRQWLKDIKTIVKDYQKADYSANKESLLRESEQRNKRREDLAALNQSEVNPTAEDNSDVWTMGIVLWQMYTGKPLFSGLTFEQAAVALLKRKIPPELDDELPNELKEILEDCFLENPDIRPNFAMIYDRIRALDCQRALCE